MWPCRQLWSSASRACFQLCTLLEQSRVLKRYNGEALHHGQVLEDCWCVAQTKAAISNLELVLGRDALLRLVPPPKVSPAIGNPCKAILNNLLLR